MSIFDAHLHIIDKRFPVVQNQGYMPDSFTVDDYLNQTQHLDIQGGAVVSGSFQGFDQTYLTEALRQLGDHFVGVTQLPYSTPDHEIIRLHQSGVRALRFNVNRGGSADISKLDYFSKRVHELVGWRTELYINASDLQEIISMVKGLPAVSIDHLGLSKSALPNVLNLVDKGVKVKAAGFGRVDFNPAEVVKKIYDIHPGSLMFGTDLPSTRAPRPFQTADIEMIQDCLGSEEAIHRVLYKNAAEWYKLL